MIGPSVHLGTPSRLSARGLRPSGDLLLSEMDPSEQTRVRATELGGLRVRIGSSGANLDRVTLKSIRLTPDQIGIVVADSPGPDVEDDLRHIFSQSPGKRPPIQQIKAWMAHTLDDDSEMSYVLVVIWHRNRRRLTHISMGLDVKQHQRAGWLRRFARRLTRRIEPKDAAVEAIIRGFRSGRCALLEAKAAATGNPLLWLWFETIG